MDTFTLTETSRSVGVCWVQIMKKSICIRYLREMLNTGQWYGFVWCVVCGNKWIHVCSLKVFTLHKVKIKKYKLKIKSHPEGIFHFSFFTFNLHFLCIAHVQMPYPDCEFFELKRGCLFLVQCNNRRKIRDFNHSSAQLHQVLLLPVVQNFRYVQSCGIHGISKCVHLDANRFPSCFSQHIIAEIANDSGFQIV